MFGTRWRLFRLLGIPISLDASWLIILALLTWTLISLFREAVPNLPEATYWVMGLTAALAFFTCIVLHELGHALGLADLYSDEDNIMFWNIGADPTRTE